MKPRHLYIVPYGKEKGKFIAAVSTRTLHWLSLVAQEQNDSDLKAAVKREYEFRMTHRLAGLTSDDDYLNFREGELKAQTLTKNSWGDKI